jgi:hypothetical protein
MMAQFLAVIALALLLAWCIIEGGSQGRDPAG